MPGKLGSYRKDVQWISGLLFVTLLMLGFFVGGVARFFAPETAKPAVASLFKDTLETRLTQNYDQTKAWLQSRPATESLEIPGIPKIQLTAGEAAALDAPGLAAKISEEVAGRIYEGDLESFSAQDRQSLGPLVYFNKATYEPIKDAAGVFAVFAAMFGFVMVVFGRRFGRLYSLGLALVAAGILPSLAYDLAKSALNNPSESAEQAAAMAALTAALQPALEGGQGVVDAYLGFGFVFMLCAAFGRSVHYMATRGKSGGAGAVHQTGALELQLPYDKTFDICMASLSSIRATVREHDRALGRVVAKTGFSWKTSGETIQIDVGEVGPETTSIRLSSKPTIRTTIFDFYGKNLENVEKMAEFLKSEEREFRYADKK